MENKEETFDVLHVENEQYLAKLFKIMKAQSRLALTDKHMTFKSTELRMISEILSAQYDGKRLISTQLADRLGVTRSAISQIVTKMEQEGVVNRVPDAVDRKIAYIEISPHVLERYGKDISAYTEFLNLVIEEFGEEKFEQMYDAFLTFTELLQQKVKDIKK